MANQDGRWAAPSLARHKPVLLALTAVALGCTVYYIRDQLWPPHQSKKGGLHRSNARRQRSRHQQPQRPEYRRIYDRILSESRFCRDMPWGSVPVSLGFLTDTAANEALYGYHIYSFSGGFSTKFRLQRRLPNIDELLGEPSMQVEAFSVRRELEISFLMFYFWRHLSPSPISEEQRAVIISELDGDGFSLSNVEKALQWHQAGSLTGKIETWLQEQDRRVEVRNTQRQVGTWSDAADEPSARVIGAADIVSRFESENQQERDGATDPGSEAGKESQTLLNLLYRIAEEQARKDGYVHRRVSCDSCNVMPIRGIRYRCANCLDYDLCEQCEAMQIHPKTHLFYKIRIPAPSLGNMRQPEPVWYPGKPSSVVRSLPKDAITKICQETGYQSSEVEALWEQFRCLAATDWPEDPGCYNLAIDRRTFNKCFVPNTSIRPSPPNLIYDRIFSFYDQNNDGLIGFEEFVKAVAGLTRKKPEERSKHIFNGYDINNDGFVDRKDFLRMFTAYYAATKELTRDIVARMDEEEVPENGAREVVLGNRPISSAFNGDILRENRGPIDGKVQDHFGDFRVTDDKGTVDEQDDDVAEADETIGDAAEAAEFGRVRPRSMIGNIDASFLYTVPWPSEFVTEEDIEKFLKVEMSPEEVTELGVQEAITRVAHGRIAKDHQRRQFIRRKAIRERRIRQNFYLESGTSKIQPDMSGIIYVEKGPVSQPDLMLHKNFRRLREKRLYEVFRDELAFRIAELDWPIDSEVEFADQVLQMLILGWTCRAIQVDFSLYGSAPDEASKLVSIICEQLEETLGQSEPDASEEKPSQSLLSPWRSRSSSKVRFQDDVDADEEHESRSATSMSSRSIPVNERWGGFEMPEPEKDVGREVLYQVTQEAFNELLDPVFRLREDLALAVQRTKGVREKCRPLIIRTIKDPWAIKRQFDMYQRRWRHEAYTNMDPSGTGECDEAEKYHTFLGRLRSVCCNIEIGLTTDDDFVQEKCPQCAEKGEKNWIMLGKYCPGHCGYLSIGRKDAPTEVERCPRCAESGEEEYIGGETGFEFCVKCSMPSAAVVKERVKLWSIISHGAPLPDNQGTLNSVGKEEHRSENDSLNRGNGNLQIEAAHAYGSFREAFKWPETPSTGQNPIQTPLNTLLEEAGYESIPDLCSPSPLDPTLPQNRPTESSPPPSQPNDHPENHIPPPLNVAAGAKDDAADSEDGAVNNVDNSTKVKHAASEEGDEVADHKDHAAEPESNTRVDINDVACYGPNGTSDRDSITSDSDSLSDGPARFLRDKYGIRLDKHLYGDPLYNATPDRLIWYAVLDMIEHEDVERGGPGRLNFEEFEEIMKGEKGSKLGFLDSWIEMAGC